jgi:hypothetical protein
MYARHLIFGNGARLAWGPRMSTSSWSSYARGAYTRADYGGQGLVVVEYVRPRARRWRLQSGRQLCAVLRGEIYERKKGYPVVLYLDQGKALCDEFRLDLHRYIRVIPTASRLRSILPRDEQKSGLVAEDMGMKGATAGGHRRNRRLDSVGAVGSAAVKSHVNYNPLSGQDYTSETAINRSRSNQALRAPVDDTFRRG